MDEDFLLAIRLQEVEVRPMSIVDESWEMLDPNPDVRVMFLEFNDMFFWGKLSGVEVKWSSRMTLCAGVCSYEGRGGLCSIRLSEPLLKLRPRKDLVETLLHEMIHALLFVTQNNRDRDGHGPEFCKHMNRINKASGTKITIYHSFHDEVDVYRQHWWRCDGPCQKRKPYFGYVKRAMNRAPSSLDPWWEDHQRTCGGTYTKIKEPEGYGKKCKKTSKTSEKKATGSGKNIIPFSGKGFILGGKSQDSTSSLPSPRPPLPVVKTPLSNPVPSPKKFFTPSSLTKSVSSPVHSNKTNGISNTFTSVRPSTSMGKKPPVKRSVGNASHFVNINGSPVKMPKSQSSSSSQGGDKIKQSSIDDLFNSTSLRKSETKRDSLISPKSSTNKTLGSDSATSKESIKAKSPEVLQRTTSATTTPSSSASLQSSAGLHSVASSSSSSSSFAVMVCCPVCQAKIQESKINEHLDSCLS
uniref:DNA-dependent metalloprotease SPRTN n=1 Tax=Astatotilapia calliptera TaxID=8154 RepID=A0A3P8RFX8_ASTCA